MVLLNNAADAGENGCMLIGKELRVLRRRGVCSNRCDVATAGVALIATGGGIAAGSAGAAVGQRGEEAFTGLSQAAGAAVASSPSSVLPDMITVVELGVGTFYRL
ncbi:hypothetical protein D3C71_1782460 [compost metagenome]